MIINEMTQEECISTLARLGFGRLACARDNQPYVVPLNFAYENGHLYIFSKAGQKVEWMRKNPSVCVEVDEITSHCQWLSVVAFGHYEELPETPDHESERNLAYKVLQERAMWWHTTAVGSPRRRRTAESLKPFYHRIHIDRVTGHRAVPDAAEGAAMAASEAAHNKRTSWVSRLLQRTRII